MTITQGYSDSLNIVTPTFTVNGIGLQAGSSELTAIAALSGVGVPQKTAPNTWSLLAVGTAANNLVQLNSEAKLPALDGSLLTSLNKSAAGLGNVENTALSTWAGSTNITTVGTLTNLTVTNTITGSVTGNAGTVTNGVYTNGSYSNPTWITSLAWSKLTSTPTTLTGYGITDAQPLDGDLTSIAGLSGTSGFLIKTAANTWSLVNSSLLHFTEATSSLSSIGTVSLTPLISDTNSNIALVPKGNGALVSTIPDNTTAGGNARGIRSVDLQVERIAATQVASGAWCVIGGGQRNTCTGQSGVVGGGYENNTSGTQATISGGAQNAASGERASVGGGIQNTASGVRATVPGGSACTASGNYSFASGQACIASGERALAIGDWCTANGNYSVALGAFADVRGRHGFFVYSAGREVQFGDSQLTFSTFRNRTTDATPTYLTTDSSTTTTTNNVYTLQSGQAAIIKGLVVGARSQAQGIERKYWEFTIAAYNNSGTLLIDSFDPVIIYDSGVSWTIEAVGAPNPGICIRVTGAAATNIQWTASMYSIESWYQ